MGLGLVDASARPGLRQSWDDRPLVIAGPLLVRADRLTLLSSLRLKAPQAVAREFHIVLTALAEPELKVLDYSGVLRLEEVRDENGNSLIPRDEQGLPANAEAFGNGESGRTSRWEVGATLAYPEKNRGRKIARFKATAVLDVITETATVEVGADMKNISKTTGALRMLVKGLDAATARYDVVVYRDGRNDAEWYRVRTLLVAGEARLLDKDGKTLAATPVGIEAEGSDDGGQMEVHLRFGGPPGRRIGEGAVRAMSQASKLVWEFGTETRTVEARFEF